MIEAKVQPIRRDLDVATQSWLGPEARAGILAEKAKLILAEADQQIEEVLQQIVPHETFVDGVKSEAIDRVRAEGTIVRTYDLMPLVLMQIGTMLWQHSPVFSGRYQRSHRLLADGQQIAEVSEGWTLPQLPSDVREFMFVPTVSYARVIEHGWSKKAPDGVYEVTAALMKQSFGRFAKISFGYRAIDGIAESKGRPLAPRDNRQPAIIVLPS